jgi:lipid II:glycine glycyltransferase (peptidoglycan interpeptide bridge formation enzyme)
MSSTNFVVRDLVEADRDTLNSFVGRNSYGDLMQSWEWGIIKSSGGDWRPLRLGAFDNAGELVGSICILVRKLPVVGNFYYAPRGPILADWSNSVVLVLLLAAVRKKADADGAAFLKIDPALPIEISSGTAIVKDAGFHPPTDFDDQGFGGTQPQTVMVLDIGDSTMDELLMACKPQCRRNVRISQKKGVEIISETKREDLPAFYDLLKITALRDGFRVRPLSYYETLWDELVPKGMGKVFLTKYEEQYLSGAFCFILGDKCVYVYGASSNENRNVMPNYGMQWAMIGWAKEQSCRLYDFRGVSPKKKGDAAAEEEGKDDHLSGLNRFKEGFGARYVEYIGEFDFVYNKTAYWLWTKGKPAAKSLLKKIRK